MPLELSALPIARRGSKWWPWLLAVWVSGGLLSAAASAQAPQREILNSERIAAKFGSYSVEILEADTGLRVTNLFSGEGDSRTCRTFAVVRYPLFIDPAVREEHAAILAGGSIGAVFAANGWEVRKTHLYFGETTATKRLATLMHVEQGTRLAEHAYVLDVVKAGRVIEYAALVEIHHPDYLVRGDLSAIYGREHPEARSDLLATLLATAEAKTTAD